MTQTREIADGIARKHEPVVSFRDVLAADIDAALTAARNAGIEEAAKVADAGSDPLDRDIADAIRSLATKEGEDG